VPGASTCRCSTCPTWTTSTWSPPRWRASSDASPARPAGRPAGRAKRPPLPEEWD
jgi:hypothetical protein